MREVQNKVKLTLFLANCTRLPPSTQPALKNKMETCLYLNKSNHTPKSQIQITIMHTQIKRTNTQKCMFQSTNRTKSNPNTNFKITNSKQTITSTHCNTHDTKLKRISSNQHFNFQPIPNSTHLCANLAKPSITNIQNKTTTAKKQQQRERMCVPQHMPISKISKTHDPFQLRERERESPPELLALAICNLCFQPKRQSNSIWGCKKKKIILYP